MIWLRLIAFWLAWVVLSAAITDLGWPVLPALAAMGVMHWAVKPRYHGRHR